MTNQTVKVVAGIDYSITSPSITIIKNGDVDFSNCQTYFLHKVKKYNKGFVNETVEGELHSDYTHNQERWDLISDWAMGILEFHNVTDVCLEGYAMGGKGKVFDLAENCGLLKHKIRKSKIDLFIIPPTELKKWVTCGGAANKQKMYESFKECTGLDIKEEIAPNPPVDKTPVSDIVDSYFLAKYYVETQLCHQKN